MVIRKNDKLQVLDARKFIYLYSGTIFSEWEFKNMLFEMAETYLPTLKINCKRVELSKIINLQNQLVIRKNDKLQVLDARKFVYLYSGTILSEWEFKKCCSKWQKHTSLLCQNGQLQPDLVK